MQGNWGVRRCHCSSGYVSRRLYRYDFARGSLHVISNELNSIAYYCSDNSFKNASLFKFMTPRHRPMPSKIEETTISFTGARLRERALVALSTRIK